MISILHSNEPDQVISMPLKVKWVFVHRLVILYRELLQPVDNRARMRCRPSQHRGPRSESQKFVHNAFSDPVIKLKAGSRRTSSARLISYDQQSQAKSRKIVR